MSTMSIISDRLRIAIALTALKHKPLDQSCAAYVLDLQTKFCSSPDSTKSSDNTDPPGPAGTSRAQSHSDDPEQGSNVWRWKSLALRLEEELEELRAKYEAEQIKSISLTAQVEAKSASETTQEPSSSVQSQVQVPSSSAGAATTENTTKKKPAKKNAKSKHPPSTAAEASVDPTKPRARIDPETISVLALEDLSDSQLPGILSSFSQLVSALPPDMKTITRPQKSLVLSTTIRVLQSISGVLKTTLFTDSGPSAKPVKASSRSTSLHRLQKVAVLLNYLLNTSLPLLRTQPKKKKSKQLSESSENTDTLIDTLTAFILNPMIHSFIPLSENFLEELFRVDDRKDPAQSTSKKTKPAVPESPIDLRIPVLNTLQNIFSVVEETYVTPGLRESLSLTVVREIVALFDTTIRISPSASASTSTRNPNQAHRDSRINESEDKENSSDAKARQRSATYDCRCSVHRRGTQTEDLGEESVAVGRRLARKDALWYLCSILHVLFRGQGGTGDVNEIGSSKHTVTGQERGVDGKEGIRLLREGVLDALLGLVSKCQTCSRRGHAQESNSEAESMIAPMDVEKSDKHMSPGALVLDEEEYEMVLAVIERYYWVLAPIVDE